MSSAHLQLVSILNLQSMRIKALILVVFSCISVNIVAEDSAILLEGNDARELVEKLGLPTEIAIKRETLALTAWRTFENKLQPLSADESCKITRRINDIMKNGTPKTRKRIMDLQIKPILSIEKCEENYANLHNECIRLIKEFYIHHYIHDTINQSTVIETFVRYTRFCPTWKMLGIETDAFKMHEILTNAK